MIYEFKENTLYLYQDGDGEEASFLAQPYNPTTREAFNSEEVAVEWLREYVRSSYDAEMINVSMTATLESDDVVDIQNEEALEITLEEAFKLSIMAEDEITSDNLILVVKGEEVKKEYKVKMSKGIAKKTLLIEEVGDYNLEVKLDYEIDGYKKIVVHKKNDFLIRIV